MLLKPSVEQFNWFVCCGSFLNLFMNDGDIFRPGVECDVGGGVPSLFACIKADAFCS